MLVGGKNDPGDPGESNEDLWIVIGEQKVSIYLEYTLLVQAQLCSLG